MGKFALLVGINYHKDGGRPLRGCVNDTLYIRNLLLAKGFAPKNIKMINDEDDRVPDPNVVEVKKGLQWLCSKRKKNDKVVFHFSGHGTYIPSTNQDEEEDEAIVLEGGFQFVDDDLKQFFSQLPVGCQATVTMDCCHSGTMLDHKTVIVGGEKAIDGKASRRTGDARGSGASGDDSPGRPRSMPVSSTAETLSQLLGEPVSPAYNDISRALALLYGGDSGKLAMSHVASRLGESREQGMDQLASVANCAKAPFSRGRKFAGSRGNAKRGVVSKLSAALCPCWSKENPYGSVLDDLGLAGQSSATSQGAPPFKATSKLKSMNEDIGVLIAACHSSELANDVPEQNGIPAHGALTYAIAYCWENHKGCTYRELIHNVRSSLHSSGHHSQNPQLECSPMNADLPFVCDAAEK